MHALGIAGTQSAGLMAAQYGAMVKRMHAGRSSQSGLYGALLAAQRLHRHHRRVRGALWRLLHHLLPLAPICFDLAQLSAGLGERFETMRIALKFYSCVASNHTTPRRHPRPSRRGGRFGLDELAKIVIRGSQVTVDHVGWPYRPEGLTSAQLNLPFCVATLLLEGDVFVDQFAPQAFADAARMELSRKVEVVHDPAITALGSKFRHKVSVSVHFKDGSIEEETREQPRGGEDAFASAADIIEKFRKLSRARLSDQRQADVIDMIMNMEKVPDMRALPEALRTV